jgi:hypothetical protein
MRHLNLSWLAVACRVAANINPYYGRCHIIVEHSKGRDNQFITLGNNAPGGPASSSGVVDAALEEREPIAMSLVLSRKVTIGSTSRHAGMHESSILSTAANEKARTRTTVAHRGLADHCLPSPCHPRIPHE